MSQKKFSLLPDQPQCFFSFTSTLSLPIHEVPEHGVQVLKGVTWNLFYLFLLGMMPLSTSWWFLPMRIASQEPNLPL